MSNDQQPNGPAPHTGWGGEYDPEATAFVQLPDGGLPGDPLAAPGHGYPPPEIGEALGPPATPAATTDPAATGQWTLPFAGAGGPGGQDGADHGRSGAAAAMGQGAAAALAGSHQGRSRRRPLGEGGTGQEAGGHPERESGPAAWEAPPPAPAASGGHGPGGTGRPADAAPGAETAPQAAWSSSSTAGPSGGGAGESGAGPGPGAPGHWSAPPEGGTHPTDPGSGDTGAWQLPSRTTQDPGPAGSPPPGPERDPGPQTGPRDAPAPAPDSGAGGEPSDGEPSDGGHLDREAAADVEAGAGEDRAPALGGTSDHPETSFTLQVNGVARPVNGSWIGESLLYVLRERLGLAGAKDGCSQGECGACSVLVDGRLVAACLVPAATAAGCEIRTCEGLADADGNPSDVQRALAATDVQCGFCLPGMAMTVHDLLEGNHDPTELETRQALCGNLCRCTGYRGVLEAVRTVVEERTERAARAQEERDGERNSPERPAAVRIPHQAGPAGGDT